MDAEETIEFFEKEHDMDTEEAKERAEGMGKTEMQGHTIDGPEVISDCYTGSSFDCGYTIEES
eukprot:COSAG01_NODE_76245_length_188_cov_31.426966_1_plen_62_part_11